MGDVEDNAMAVVTKTRLVCRIRLDTRTPCQRATFKPVLTVSFRAWLILSDSLIILRSLGNFRENCCTFVQFCVVSIYNGVS